jgi:hypothetical protein
VIRTKNACFAPQVWSAIVCSIAVLTLNSGLVGPQTESAKRTSNGLVIKSSGSVQTPQLKAPSRFKVPTAAQYKAIQEKEAGRARTLDVRSELRRSKNPRPVTGNGKVGSRDVK